MFIRSLQTHSLSTGFFGSRIKLFNITAIRALHYEIRTPTTDLDRLGGYLDVKHSLTDVVHYLQNPSVYLKAGIKPPKGVLLSGPPGVGKTMIAEAVAGHSGVPIIVTSASDILDKWVGGAEEKLRQLFRLAKQHAPCVLLFDEFDSIAGERFSSPKTVNERHDNAIANELLSLLSKEMPGVIVMATTNHADALDAAVMRPGRFDRHIVMAMPNYLDRLDILRRCIKKKNLDPAIKLEDLAAITSTFSGAKLITWLNEAALFALKEKSKRIQLSHLDKARTIIQRGSLGSCLSDENKIKVALHETGHALVGYLLGSRLYKISILQTGHSLGLTEFIPIDNDVLTKQAVLNLICISLAGRAAECEFGGPEIGSSEDLRLAIKWAKYLVCNEGLGRTLSGLERNTDIESILQNELARAQKLLRKHEISFHRVVRALTHENELNENEFLSVLNHTYVASNKVEIKDTRTYPKKKQHNALSVATGQGFFKGELAHFRLKMTPFTIDEVSKVIGVASREIHVIEFGQNPGWYNIKFKPHFIKQKEFCEKLKSNQIEYDYDHHLFELRIKPTGADDFIHLVKTGKKPGI